MLIFMRQMNVYCLTETWISFILLIVNLKMMTINVSPLLTKTHPNSKMMNTDHYIFFVLNS